jgi:hypothetical protein
MGEACTSHFRMDGSWHLYRPGQLWPRPGHRARAVLTTQERVAVGFCLHDMALLVTRDEHRLVGHLRPDLLNPTGTTKLPRSRRNDYANNPAPNSVSPCSTSGSWPECERASLSGNTQPQRSARLCR